MSALWRVGEGVRLDASREALEREATSRLLLLPKPKTGRKLSLGDASVGAAKPQKRPVGIAEDHPLDPTDDDVVVALVVGDGAPALEADQAAGRPEAAVGADLAGDRR